MINWISFRKYQYQCESWRVVVLCKKNVELLGLAGDDAAMHDLRVGVLGGPSSCRVGDGGGVALTNERCFSRMLFRMAKTQKKMTHLLIDNRSWSIIYYRIIKYWYWHCHSFLMTMHFLIDKKNNHRNKSRGTPMYFINVISSKDKNRIICLNV